MNLRRKLLAFLQSQKKAVEYTELEWIGNESNCYIFFPLVTSGKDIIELEYEAQFTRTDVPQAEGKNGDPYFFMGLQNSVWYAGCGGYGNSTVKADTEWHHFRLVSYGDDNGFWLDGTRIFQSTPRDGVYLPQGFRLWIGQGGSRTTYNRKKYVKVKVNGKLVYDLIPVLDKDLTPCLYDKLTGKYFYNDGTGEFTWRLPNQLEYIGNEENCYINVPIATNALDVIEIEQEVQYTNASFNQAEIKNGNPYFFMGIDNSLNWYAGIGGYGSSSIKADTNWHTMKIVSYGEDRGLWLDGERIYKGSNSTGNFLPYGFELWKCQGTTGWRAVNRKKYVKATVNGKIKCYLLPVFDENLNICMYDLVSKKYYYNQGTGSFKGFFEDGTQLVSYLSSTGTQWIDTGIFGTENISIETGFEFTTKDVQYLFGSSVTYNKDTFCHSINPSSGKLYRTFIGARTGTFGNVGEVFSTKMSVNNAYFSTTQIRLDDEVYDFTSVTPFKTPTPMYLFAKSNNGTVDYFAKVKVKFFKIYDNGVLVQNLIPVVKSDGTACMLDLASKKYFVNAGTGTFNYG